MAPEPDIPSEDSPFRRITGLVSQERTRAQLDEIFQFDETNLQRTDVEVEPLRNTATVEKTGFLDDEEFDTFRSKASDAEALNFTKSAEADALGLSRRKYVVDPLALETPDPVTVHNDRPRDVMETDKRRKATVTIDPEQYASDPERYDYPFVDTPPEFNDIFAFPDPTGELEMKAGRDKTFTY